MNLVSDEFHHDQWRSAKGQQPKVKCPCGWSAPLRFMYRCYFCGVFFCDDCAGEHFGKPPETHLEAQSDGR